MVWSIGELVPIGGDSWREVTGPSHLLDPCLLIMMTVSHPFVYFVLNQLLAFFFDRFSYLFHTASLDHWKTPVPYSTPLPSFPSPSPSSRPFRAAGPTPSKSRERTPSPPPLPSHSRPSIRSPSWHVITPSTLPSPSTSTTSDNVQSSSGPSLHRRSSQRSSKSIHKRSSRSPRQRKMTHSLLCLRRQTSSSSLFRSRAEPYPVAMGATSSSEWETTSTTSADVPGTTLSASETEEDEDEEDVFTSPGEEEYDGDTNDEIVRSRRVSV